MTRSKNPEEPLATSHPESQTVFSKHNSNADTVWPSHRPADHLQTVQMAAAHVRKHIQKKDTRCRSERSLPKQRTLADFLVPLTRNKSQKTQSCQVTKGNQSSLEYSGHSAQILSTYCLPAPVEVQTQSSANSQTLPTPERTVLNPQMTRLTRAQILAQFEPLKR